MELYKTYETRFSVLLNIMFHALMGKFQLELFIFITYFSTVFPFNKLCFLSCRPFVVNATFLTGLVGCWSFFCLLAWSETSTPNKTRWECRVNNERPTGKKTTIEWEDCGKYVIKINNSKYRYIYEIAKTDCTDY